MGLRPTQRNESRITAALSGPYSGCRGERHPPLCHPDRSVAERRDLQFSGSLVEMFLELPTLSLAVPVQLWRVPFSPPAPARNTAPS